MLAMGGEYCTTFCNELLNMLVQTQRLGLPAKYSPSNLLKLDDTDMKKYIKREATQLGDKDIK